MKTRLISILLVSLLLLGAFSVLASCDNTNVPSQPTENKTEAATEPLDEDTAQTSAETDESSSETISAEDTAKDTERETEPESETLPATEKETESETESETEGETEYQGPAEPGCDECSFKTVKGLPVCKVCGFVARCRGEHGYTSDLNGHWKPACEHCGKASGKSQNHEYEEKVVDEGDLLVYSFRCTICKFKAYEQEVPYEINSFYSAGDLSYTDVSGALQSQFGFESGVGYASYSSEKGGSSTVIVVSNGEVGDSSGRYLVMKVRLPASASSFAVNIKSVGAYGHQSMLFSGLKATWTTLIVDVTKAVSVQKVRDSQTGIEKEEKFGYHDANGEYFLGDLRFTATAGAGESFDVAYVMMCETLEDAKAFTENEKTRLVYEDILNEKPESDQKQCVDENGNPIIHQYIVNDDGTHTLKESCHQCGLTAVSNEPHAYSQTVDANGDYTYACGACGHSKYGVAVNKYIPTQEIDTAGHTYYKMNKLGITEDESGFDYSSYSGQSTTAQIIFARTGFSTAEASSAFPVGKANLFIIRMRTNTPAVSFGIQFGTEGAKVTNFRFPTALAGDGWATYVVDLAKAIPTSYVADQNGEYVITNFYFHIGAADFTNDVVYDVDFMAFVDEWEEVGVLTPDEKVINVVGANAGGWVNTADRTCVEGMHSLTVDSSEGKHRVVCGSCGFVQKEYDISSDVERFMPAEILAGITNAAGSIDTHLITEGEGEDAVSFVRLDNMKLNNDREAWMGWGVMNSAAAPVSGQYMVMKLRLPKDQLGQTFFEFYTATKQSLAAGMRVAINVSEDDEWHTVVIDLSKCVADAATYFVPDEDGYHVRYLQMRLFSGHQSTPMLDEDGNKVIKTYTNSNGEEKTYEAKDAKPAPEMYMDIAYIAYCDDIKEVCEIADTETYEYYEASQSSSLRNSADGSCFTHSYSDVVDGETHRIICSGCGDVAKIFTVSKDINYYADLGAMSHFNSTLSKGLYDEENRIVFNRYEGAAGAHLNLTGGGGAGTWTKDKFETGKYIVIKYRTSGGIFPLNVSTKDNGNSKAFPDDKTRPEYSQVGVKTVNAGEGKWTVALIEMTSEVKNYTTSSEQEIGIMISASGNYLIDIAYVAVVDSEDEAKTLLGEGESLEIGWSSSGEGDGGTTTTPPSATDHKITETVKDGENGAKIYTYSCAHCDVNLEKNVPASVAGYFSANKMASGAAVYFQIGGHALESDESGAFARFTGSDKVSQALWLRSQADCNKSTTTGMLANVPSVDLGQSKYMIVRARTNNTSNVFRMAISTTGYNSPTATSVDGTEGTYNINGTALQAGDLYATAPGYVTLSVPLSAAKADEWTVYVIDLSTVASDYYVKDSETGTYILDTFYFHFDSFAASTTLDIDYVGFVETWEDIDTVVSEESVVNITSISGGSSIVDTAAN